MRVTKVLHAALAMEDEHEAEEASEGDAVLVLKNLSKFLRAV